MAARKNLNHSERTRAKIRTSMLLNRLESFVEGKTDLNAAQVSAALGLIKKTLPDLQAITLDGEVDHNVKVSGALAWKPAQ